MSGMPTPPYASLAPTVAEVAALPGPTLLEFGTGWCGHCRAALPAVASALTAHPRVRHLRIEDGPGRRLGRSFNVTLWPTLVLLVDGRELARLVRPTSAAAVALALSVIDPIA
jgi:thioredoxin 1